jgi:16S rRNA (cytosine1402-N4)-methyltransferase
MPGRGARGNDRGARCGPARHVSVLLQSVLETLNPQDGEVYVDGTFGAGGYTRAILEAADCRVIAIDQDPAAIERAEALQQQFGERLIFLAGRFSQMQSLLDTLDVTSVNGIVLDVGVSSMQLDDPERGFSFQNDGPLDMRMSRRGLSAADVVNTFKEADLARIIAALGEERRARFIARAICAERKNAPFSTTLQLADLITSVLGRAPQAKTHPATRTFQALRIYVNRELDELADALFAAEQLLSPDGRLVVVSFHSLEDRIVKQFLTSRSTPKARPSRHLPELDLEPQFEPSFSLLHRKPIGPNDDEMDQNPRARSARLRAAKRLEAAAMTADKSELKIPRTPDPEQ